MVCGTPQATLGSSAGKLALVSGYSWRKHDIPKPEDHEGHFNKDGFLPFPEEQSVTELAEAMG